MYIHYVSKTVILTNSNDCLLPKENHPFVNYGGWISESLLKQAIRQHDIIVVNMGLHYPHSHLTPGQLKIHFIKVGQVLKHTTFHW